MTIEEKAKHYDEALERMKSWVRGEHPECFTEAKKAAEFIFPELKESEDEKIRKALIRLHKSTIDIDGIKGEDIIAWLEKQGEQKLADKIEPKDYSSIDPHFFKTTDKVEPKFHEGEWVFIEEVKGYKNGPFQIKTVDSFGYSFDEYHTIPFMYEELLSKWTIQDAKAGDVLAISWWKDNNLWEKIIIFKKYHNKDVEGLYYMPCVEGYGNTFKNGKLAFNEKVPYYSKTWTCNLHPATKEQRDALEKAMADAGYAFDFENKELKKLGQSEVTKMSDQEEIAEIPFGAKDSELQEATYYIPKGFHAEIDDDKVVIKKGEKPTAWSEEDEQITLSIEQVMNCASLLNIVPEKMDKIRTWLKSLKKRIGG